MRGLSSPVRSPELVSMLHLPRFAALLLLIAFATAGSAAEPLRIHMISGSGEYKSEPSLKKLIEDLEADYQIECTASWGRDGVKELENLQPLAQADLMLIFARRMKLGEEQMELIRQHWEQGKPVIGIRTAGHAFQKEDNELFDRKVLGGHYSGHYGKEPVKVKNAEAAADHPVLAGVGGFTSEKLYKAGELAPDTVVLQTGDNGKAEHPVTIVHEYNGGRMFFTSLGVPADFENEHFRRMLLNAIFWTTGREAVALRKGD